MTNDNTYNYILTDIKNKQLYNISYEHGLKDISPLRGSDDDFSTLSGDQIYSIVKHDFKLIQALRDGGVDFSKLDRSDIYTFISYTKNKIETTKALRDAGVDFSELGRNDIYTFISYTENKIEAIKVLRDVGGDFSKLDISDIYTLISSMENKIEATNALRDAGADFSKLDLDQIYSIVKHDFKLIQALRDGGADFSKLDSSDIYKFISSMENKIETTKALRDVGADFSKLDGSDIYTLISYTKNIIEIIKALSDAGADFSKLGSNIYKFIGSIENNIETIKALRDAGVDFSKLDGSDIYTLISYRKNKIETIKALGDSGTDFSKLDGSDIYKFIGSTENIIETAKALRDAGAKQDGILDPHKVIAIKKLCEPVIQNDLQDFAKRIQKLEEALEKTNFFEKLPTNITSMDELEDVVQNSPELTEITTSVSKSDPEVFMDSEDNSEDNYIIDINGEKIKFIPYSTQEGDSALPTSQGKLAHWSNIINCGRFDGNSTQEYKYNQIAQMFNKHGSNIELLPELKYNDTQLEEMFILVDFTNSIYDERTDCQEYASSFSGAINAVNYCPKAPTPPLVQFTIDSASEWFNF